MATRLELHEKLKAIVPNVYYQPPESIKIVYPCIIYDLARDDALHADNAVYKRWKRYSVTLIDRNPDSLLPDQFSDAFNAGMERHYTSDNLHHYSYTIIF